MQRLGIILITVVLVTFGYAAGQAWSGRVVDVRTGAPIRGVALMAGNDGRVDAFPGYRVESGSDGSFTIVCPKDFMDGMAKAHKAHWLRIEGQGYIHVTVVRPIPKQVRIELVPSTIWIKGRAVSAENGAPLPDIGVSVMQPGSIVKGIQTDSSGGFAFGPLPAFTNMSEAIYDVDPPSLVPPPLPPPKEYQPWMVILYGRGGDVYKDVSPPIKDNRFVPPLALVSSATDVIYTWVELRLPKKNATVAAPGPYVVSQSRGLPTSKSTEPEKVSVSAPKQWDAVSLGNVWIVEEPLGWKGHWTRRKSTNTFDAEWTNSSGAVARDVIEIVSVTGNQVVLLRRGMALHGKEGRYRGTLSSDGRTITGTASWYQEGWTWTARIR